MQCGYCIPGFVLMAHELLAENPQPDPRGDRDHLEGNICRCGTYPEILTAIEAAAAAGAASETRQTERSERMIVTTGRGRFSRATARATAGPLS